MSTYSSFYTSNQPSSQHLLHIGCSSHHSRYRSGTTSWEDNVMFTVYFGGEGRQPLQAASGTPPRVPHPTTLDIRVPSALSSHLQGHVESQECPQLPSGRPHCKEHAATECSQGSLLWPLGPPFQALSGRLATCPKSLPGSVLRRNRACSGWYGCRPWVYFEEGPSVLPTAPA